MMADQIIGEDVQILLVPEKSVGMWKYRYLPALLRIGPVLVPCQGPTH